MALKPTSRLEAVNVSLTNTGESPVTDLDSGLLVDAQIASDVLDEISRAVQSIGWHFNTEVHTLLPDVAGTLYVPASTLKADATNTSDDLVLRNTRMYDRTTNSYVFTEAKRLEIVVYLDFLDLPEPARRLITLRAARVFQERQLGVDSISQENRQDEAAAWTAMLHDESDAGDYNILNNPAMAKIARR